MKHAVIYIHGMYGTADEAEHYKKLFPDCDVIGFDYKKDNVFDTNIEFSNYYDEISSQYDKVSIIANSQGAYFAMHALDTKKIETAYFISPIADMQKLIEGMMYGAGITEEELERKQYITLETGIVLSWKWLEYAKIHEPAWTVPTYVLYGDKDFFTDPDTMQKFADKYNMNLTVMKDGEHWFHTAEQMLFLDEWIIQSTF